MRNIGRKGVISDVGKVIITLVVLLILLLFAAKLVPMIFAKSDREVCRTSVAAQSAIMNLPNAQNIIEPDCKTYSVVFFNDHVERSGKRIEVYDSREKTFVKSFDGLTNEIVNQVTAEELRWCWYQFLEGEKPVIDRRNWLSFNPTMRSLCFLCDEITFDSSVRQDQFKGFYQFTKDTDMLNSQMTYYAYYAEQPRLCEYYSRTVHDKNCWEAYFAGEITSKDAQMTPENTVFNRTGKYLVTFIMFGLNRPAGFAPVLEGEVDNFAYVLPYDSLKDQCARLIRGPSE